jgi:hypothetical protein
LCDAYYDAHQGVPPDTRHVTDNPKDVRHAAGSKLLAVIIQ